MAAEDRNALTPSSDRCIIGLAQLFGLDGNTIGRNRSCFKNFMVQEEAKFSIHLQVLKGMKFLLKMNL